VRRLKRRLVTILITALSESVHTHANTLKEIGAALLRMSGSGWQMKLPVG